jgi:hypothetical protein
MQGDPREIQLIRTRDSREIWRKYRHTQRKKMETRGKQEDNTRRSETNLWEIQGSEKI